MKNLYAPIFILSAFLALCSCSGSDGDNGEPEKKLTLSADKIEIEADGKDTSTFTVMYGGENVTSQATVVNETLGTELPLGMPQFVTTTPGVSKFHALFDGKTSENTVTITAIEENQEKTLTLIADRELLFANGSDEVVFTVMLNRTDVTAEAKIKNTTAGAYLDYDREKGYYFTTSKTDEVEFIAEYDEYVTEPVTITPINAFRKNVTILKFTGTWCQWCYPAGNALETALESYPDNTNVIAIHHNDNMVSSMTSKYQKEYGVASWPALCFDDYNRVGNNTASVYKSAIEYSLENYPATCGFLVSSSVDNGTAKVNIRMMATEEGEYRLVTALVENNILDKQETPSGKLDEYVHNNVLRQCAPSVVMGDILGNMGAMSSVEKEYSFDIRRYKEEDCYILVYALKKSGDGRFVINNSIPCPINGKAGSAN